MSGVLCVASIRTGQVVFYYICGVENVKQHKVYRSCERYHTITPKRRLGHARCLQFMCHMVMRRRVS